MTAADKISRLVTTMRSSTSTGCASAIIRSCTAVIEYCQPEVVVKGAGAVPLKPAVVVEACSDWSAAVLAVVEGAVAARGGGAGRGSSGGDQGSRGGGGGDQGSSARGGGRRSSARGAVEGAVLVVVVRGAVLVVRSGEQCSW